MIYLLHFHEPFGHAQHYLGYTAETWPALPDPALEIRALRTPACLRCTRPI